MLKHAAILVNFFHDSVQRAIAHFAPTRCAGSKAPPVAHDHVFNDCRAHGHDALAFTSDDGRHLRVFVAAFPNAAPERD